jgi:hypothetical protein
MQDFGERKTERGIRIAAPSEDRFNSGQWISVIGIEIKELGYAEKRG